MYEYSSVSASSYDPGALVAKLNEAAADGWDVVSIVPTGGDVSAFLRRDLDAELDEAIAEEVALEDAIAEEEAIEGGRGSSPSKAVARRSLRKPSSRKRPPARSRKRSQRKAAAEEAGERPSPTAAAVAAGAWAADGATEAAPSEPAGVVEVTEVAEVTEPVEEPAGWATAPAAADESPAETAACPEDATPVAEPSPAPAPEPEPEPAPAAAAPEPAPVVTTPAGWYPDPAGRYELRYWDGTQWTEHVARQGQQFTDPPVR